MCEDRGASARYVEAGAAFRGQRGASSITSAHSAVTLTSSQVQRKTHANAADMHARTHTHTHKHMHTHTHAHAHARNSLVNMHEPH